ncbi:MAG: squalene/phytoene synthase family protein [Alphaproteobacteria bacterium]|nr:squalene/phytoene synthase family protein [Alphaproteobacteria bacterium]HPF46637.1 phytoene/squalene synthase family protein [Emcibacteraceae bacterium]HRW30152.1 phytoene/squalene synthase family protein [Emcibacteraceae bacterium]
MSELDTYCAKQIKKYDYDRFLITLFARADIREDLFALYSFNHEVAKIREAVSEPMLGEIRLQWWREAIEGIASENPRNHEVVLPLSDAFHRHGLSADSFIDIIDARSADIYDENPNTIADFETYLGATSGNLMKIAARISGERDEHALSLCYDLGMVWGLIGTIRALRFQLAQGKLSLPQDIMHQFEVRKSDLMALEGNENIKRLIRGLHQSATNYLNQISKNKKSISKDIQPLFLLSALSRSYLNMIRRAGYDPFKLNERASMFPRQCRLFFSALFGIV